MDRRRDGKIMGTGMRGRGMVRRGGEVLDVNSEMRGEEGDEVLGRERILYVEEL